MEAMEVRVMEIKITVFGIAMFLGYTAWTMLAKLVGGYIVEHILDRLRWRRWEKEQEEKMLANVARIRADEDRRLAEQEDKQ